MGKFADKFMGAFSGKEDDFDDYEEDYYDDDLIDEENMDDFEEKKPSKGLGGWFKGNAAQDPEPKERDSRDIRDQKDSRDVAPKSGNYNPYPRNTKPMRPSSGIPGGNEVCIFKPTSIEDSREITETLLQGKAVVINFEGLHIEISQRIIDFISGACYALNGNLQKISNFIFIATPDSVDISGDFQDLLATDDNLLDMSGIKPTLMRP